MKALKVIVVMIIVFGLPAGSYLYLRSGFMYRLNTLEILKEKVQLSAVQNSFLIEKDSTVFDTYNDGVSLFHRIETKLDTTDLYFLAESLKTRRDFQLIALVDEDNYSMIDDTIYSQTIHRIKTDTETMNQFFGDARFMLAKDSFLRKNYGDSQEEFLLAYEHTVVLLPMKKKDEVKLIRNTTTQ